MCGGKRYLLAENTFGTFFRIVHTSITLTYPSSGLPRSGLLLTHGNMT